MSGYIIDETAKVLCAHSQVPVRALLPDPRVSVSGGAVMTVRRFSYSIQCPASTSACTAGEWKSGAQRVFAGGRAVAIHSGWSSCTPNNLPMHPEMYQKRVTAS
jgi:hypothetical protein